MKKREKKQLNKFIYTLILLVVALLIAYLNPLNKGKTENVVNSDNTSTLTTVTSFDLDSIPEYKDSPYVYINNNKPYFEEKDYTTKVFENYSDLDNLGRCGVAYANICTELMPKAGEKRGSISSIYPSGWKQAMYKGIVDQNALYNRCHLIGWQLAGENANKKNLITGTRYMNVQGMLPFENMVDDYFEEDENIDNHVLYRVTPIFKGSNLVASGVEMEAYSVEDNGKGICFNVYVYNVQPGIEIDYSTGESKLAK